MLVCSISESASMILGESFMVKPRIFNRHRKKRVIMNKSTRNRLEVELTNMLNHHDQAMAKRKKPIPQLGTGNIIRRRKGEKDKRFSTCIEHRAFIAATG